MVTFLLNKNIDLHLRQCDFSDDMLPVIMQSDNTTDATLAASYMRYMSNTSGPARRSAICVREPRSLHAYILMALNTILPFRRYKK